MSYFLEQLKNVKERVTHLLNYRESCKDDDNILIANYWWFEIGKDNINQTSAIQLMQLFVDKKLTSPETIRRCRQKLQEEFPELRGKSYKTRKKEGEIVKQKIKK
jgi:hypothetical protein